ncbi:glycosyltransferase family 2 protein [Desulfosediminicola flagellatus]|uniref:glycosyltransferase family 2 protein n=1 Tax=Desulfosediminicola flagellatus TaxID=2569541 RepID=UPI00142EB894|nr:glycosyltransferase family 2 protein [Desulfosediminicola flagellatus]
MNKTNVFIVIAAYNEEMVIEDVIDEIQHHNYHNIVVVDDGSKDFTFDKSKKKGVIALRHRINRGKGAAVKTGIVAANRLGADVIVTIDGDGQHDPSDIKNLTEPIICENIEVVLGVRRKIKGEMPYIKIIANKIGNLVTFLLYGIHVSDSQSGYRAYSRYAAKIIDTKADKYEYDSKVIREINNNRLSFKEVPIQVRYTEYSMGKAQKQGFINGLKTMFRMIWGMIV